MRSVGQKASQAHEKRLAKVVGGKAVGGSGNGWSHKGDVRSDDMLIEHKWTGAKSRSIQAAELEKIVKEALHIGRLPVFGLSLNNKNYVILTEDDFLELKERADG